MLYVCRTHGPVFFRMILEIVPRFGTERAPVFKSWLLRVYERATEVVRTPLWTRRSGPAIRRKDSEDQIKTNQRRERASAMQAFKRLAQPEDIAGVVAFRASDDAHRITGDIVRVDRSRHARK